MQALFRRQKPSIHAGFLHFREFRFTLPVGDRVTIAETGVAQGELGGAVIRRGVSTTKSASGVRFAHPPCGTAQIWK
jgi:hypothetical protein